MRSLHRARSSYDKLIAPASELRMPCDGPAFDGVQNGKKFVKFFLAASVSPNNLQSWRDPGSAPSE